MGITEDKHQQFFLDIITALNKRGLAGYCGLFKFNDDEYANIWWSRLGWEICWYRLSDGLKALGKRNCVALRGEFPAGVKK